MRLDKYLKVSRLIKRRTVANEACDNERVSVNGRVQRASYEVKPGDKIAIRFGARTLEVEVLSVADNVGKADAAAMYREIGGATPEQGCDTPGTDRDNRYNFPRPLIHMGYSIEIFHCWYEGAVFYDV